MPENFAVKYKSLMVRLSVRGGDEGLVRLAGDLAERFESRLTGIAAYPAMPQMFPSFQIAYGGMVTPDDMIEQYRATAQNQIDEAEARFRSVLQGRACETVWRSAVTDKPIAKYLSQQARSADLFITHPMGVRAPKDAPRMVNVGDIVMNIGRPILMVPPERETLDFGTALIAWKDTRATRRAVWDALPLLMQAKRVVVVQIAADAAADEARAVVSDVADWLGLHGIQAESVIKPAAGNDANRLAAILREFNADLVVAGAYGHARFREWMLGSVTSDLLLHPSVVTLVSH